MNSAPHALELLDFVEAQHKALVQRLSDYFENEAAPASSALASIRHSAPWRRMNSLVTPMKQEHIACMCTQQSF
eukprot:Skav219498  [mRNA]  locus=scaffold937:130346:135138:- [translate_table: standard]